MPKGVVGVTECCETNNAVNSRNDKQGGTVSTRRSCEFSVSLSCGEGILQRRGFFIFMFICVLRQNRHWLARPAFLEVLFVCFSPASPLKLLICSLAFLLSWGESLWVSFISPCEHVKTWKLWVHCRSVAFCALIWLGSCSPEPKSNQQPNCGKLCMADGRHKCYACPGSIFLVSKIKWQKPYPQRWWHRRCTINQRPWWDSAAWHSQLPQTQKYGGQALQKSANFVHTLDCLKLWWFLVLFIYSLVLQGLQKQKRRCLWKLVRVVFWHMLQDTVNDNAIKHMIQMWLQIDIFTHVDQTLRIENVLTR